MKKEISLWARKAGDQEWEEQLITSTSDPAHLAAAKKWATENGFAYFRETVFKMEKPDFAKAVKV